MAAKTRRPIRWARLLPIVLCVTGACAQDKAPDASGRVPVHLETLEVDAGRTWSADVAVPAFTADEAPVLSLRARLQTKHPGGCNYVLQILLAGRALTEDPMRPRLVNKAPWFDPPDTGYHFSWYGPREKGWMTIFSPGFEGDWGGTGRDFDFRFDLSGLVTPGQALPIAFRYLNPDIPAALGVSRAPLTMDRVALEVLPRAEVQRLRKEAQEGQEPRAVPVTTTLPPDAVPGERPYEIVWSGREESPQAQVAFDDLTGWTMQALGDGELSLAASVDHLLWRPQLARFTYGAGTADTVVEIRPPEPILIPDRFDAANLWLYGAWDRMHDTPLRIVALLEDQAGREVELDLGSVTAAYWGLQHGVLAPQVAAAAQFPLRFTALRLSNCKSPIVRHAYLESLAFYRQQRNPQALPARRESPLFPTSDDGMLPTPPAGVVTSATAVGSGARFSGQFGADCVQYRVRPEAGVLDGVTARFNGGRWLQPMAGGGVVLAGDETPADKAEVISSSLEDGRLKVRWQRADPAQPTEWEAEYRLRGCTLVVDVRCPGGKATGLAFGQVRGLRAPRGIEVPYLLMGPKPGPWIACAEGMFVSVLPDWYHSDFSSVNTRATAPQGNRIGLLQGTTYLPLTDGRRNPLRDRVLVTVSREFADTLPNSRNPVSPNRERLAPYLFFMSDQLTPTLYESLKSFGVDRLIASDFASILVANNYPEGFAARWRPHPTLTMEQVQAYRRGIKDLGYLFSTYMDVTDYYPGNALWDEDRVALDGDGDFVDGWWGNYIAKPTVTPGIVREVGMQAMEAYPSDCVYLDVHTNRGPEALDFEAGAPGAGIARSQVVANGDCIAEARKWYGATISEGLYRWMYAGICDMDYATLVTTGTAAQQAPLVDFDLLKIHPFQHGTMMGHHPDRFLSAAEQAQLTADTGGGQAPEGFYKYVAGSLAYGHMLLLGYWYVPPPARFVHYYALMQGVQSEYLTDNAGAIEYHNGAEFAATSRALQDGSQQMGRVHVRYSRGLSVYVNCNPEKPWKLVADGQSYDLPPYGWLIVKPGEILAYSALRDGKRVDFVRCPEYLYLHTGGARVRQGPIEAEGAVWLKRQGASWRVIPCGDLGQWERFPAPDLPQRFSDYRPRDIPAKRGCAYLALDISELVGKSSGQVKVTARDDTGAPVEGEVRVLDDERVELRMAERLAAYFVE